MKTIEMLKEELAKAIDAGDFDAAKAIKAEIASLEGVTDDNLLPEEALKVEASDGREGWNPKGPLPFTTVKLMKQVAKKKRGSDKEDFRLELKYTESITLKMFLSSLKRLWMDAGEPADTLLRQVGTRFDLNDKLQIKWDANTGNDAKDYPFRAAAKHA